MTTNDDRPRFHFTRRKFILVGSAVGAATVFAEDAASVTEYISLGRKSFTRHLRRREDQLSLRFDFYNLVRDTRAGKPSQLIRKFPGLGTFVAVTFPPQSVGDETVPHDQASPPYPVGSVVSGPTRLVFVVPDRIATIPFTGPGLLDWLGWSHNVAPYAGSDPARPPRAPATATPHAPLPAETAIELPWRLALSPIADPDPSAPEPTWIHATEPVTRNGRTELWHTRFGSTVPLDRLAPTVRKETDLVRGPLRAIWAFPGTEPFQPTPAPTEPVNLSMTASDRTGIVDNTATRPIDVRQLMLTPLGGYFEGGGNWPDRNVVEWRHRSTLGRDHYVKVVKAGYLYPFGHPVARLDVSERKFTVVNGRKTAYLRKRSFIVIRRRTLEYPVGMSVPNDRRFPFRSITLGVEVTPPLAESMPRLSCALVQVAETPGATSTYRFPCIGVDQDGHEVGFAAPLVWVPKEIAFDGPPAGAWNSARAAHLADPQAPRIPLGGQRLSIVPSRPAIDGEGTDGRDVSFPADTLVIDGALGTAIAELDRPPFGPVMDSVTARIPAVAAVTGSSAPIRVYYADAYLRAGFTPSTAGRKAGVTADVPPNFGEVFASFTPPSLPEIPSPLDPPLPALPVELPANLAGGVAAPSFVSDGLSRVHGAVADLKNTAIQALDPTKYFDQLEAKLLGTVPLKEILAFVDDVKGEVDKLPNLHTTLIHPGGDKLKPPIGSLTILDFAPKAQSDPLKVFVPTPATKITLHVEIRTDFREPEKSTYLIRGTITAFTLQLIGTTLPAIDIPVNRLVFRSATGSKTDLDLDIGKVRFKGVMSFVNDLAKYVYFTSKSGPYVDVTPTGIVAGVRLTLPPIGAGLFQISNVAFAMAIRMPFTSRMRMDIAFSSRKEPFLITVYGIGGGGWLTLGLGLDGFESFEAGLEFGASVAIDLGVASGEVHVFIGVYFSMLPKSIEVDVPSGEGAVTKATRDVMETRLEAFLRLGGSVEVLGLVTLSIELYIGFTYVFPYTDGNNQPAGNLLIGRATLVMEVDVLMFSETVRVEVERTVEGPAILEDVFARRASVVRQPDRSFGERVSEPDWADYCDAFAIGA